VKYSKKYKVELVTAFKRGKFSIGELARREKISKPTLSRWIRLYSLGGKANLERRKSGPKETPINAKFESLVLNLWKKEKRSPYMMRKDLQKNIKRNGHDISERQIKKIYKKNRLYVS